MIRSMCNICAGVTLVILTHLNPAFAAPEGTVQTDFGGRESITGMVLQPDGKLVAVGYFYGGSYSNSFALARYGTDGRLDTTFGTGGKVLTTAFGASSGYAAQAEGKAVALQADGKIVVAGDAYTNDIALARYNPDGSLDTTFGTGGKVVTDWDALSELAFAVGIQSTGKIIVGGYTDAKGTFDFVMTRYNSDGTIDTTFGTNGTVYTDFNASDDRIAALKIIGSDKILAVGRSGGNMALARFTADGVLDNPFGASGKVTTDFGGNDEARALAIDANGNIVVAGPAGINGDFGLARYTANGSLDSKKFGSGGKVITNLGSTNDQAAAIGIDSTGKIVVAGYVNNGSGFEVLRYSSSGNLDNTFGSSGRVTTRIGSKAYEQAVALVIQGNDQIIVGGNAGSVATQDNFALARYNANNGSLDTGYGAKADLAVTVTGSPDPVMAGSDLTYSITVSNAGPDAAEAINVNGLSNNSIVVSVTSSMGTCAYTTCSLGTLNSGASATVTVVVNPVAVGSLSNTVSVESITADTVPANNSAVTTTTVTGTADVSIAKSASPNPAKVGANLTYTLTVTNNGPDTATGVTVTDTLPNTLNFVSASSSQGSCTGVSVVTCTLGTINNGSSATVTIVTTPTANGSLTNTASVSSGVTDPNTANNSASVSTTVNSNADMSVTVSGSPGSIKTGEVMTYTYVIRNNGPDAASHANIVSRLSGTTFMGVSTTTGCPSMVVISDYFYCDVGTLASGAHTTVTIQAVGATAGTAVNNVTVESDIPDPNAANNTATASTSVIQSVADMSLTLTDNPDPVEVGSNLTYTLTIANNGPDNAYGVYITGTLPSQVQFVSATSSDPACSGGTSLVCSRIDSGTSITVTYVVRPIGTGLITYSSNIYYIRYANDPDTANNSASESTTVTGSADLAVTMTDSPDPVKVNTTLTYTMTVTNNGPNIAGSASLTDTLSSGVTYGYGTTSIGASCFPNGGNTVWCPLGTIASGASVTATLYVTPTAKGTITNAASVTSSVTDPNSANNNATASTSVSNK